MTPEKEKAGKRTLEPPTTQPQAKIAKTEPEARVVYTDRIPLGNYWEFSSAAGFEHLDHRWLRTAWWHRFERKWYPRDPSKPIIWASPDNWKPESSEEFEARTKGWVKEGERLEHKEVQVGEIYRLFENPACKVRVTDLNRYHTNPKCTYRTLTATVGVTCLLTSWRARC